MVSQKKIENMPEIGINVEIACMLKKLSDTLTLSDKIRKKGFVL